MKTCFKLITVCGLLPLAAAVGATEHRGDTADLDDLDRLETVSMETCLDNVLDTVPGNPRKLEMKLEGNDPVYEFEVEGANGQRHSVECDAEDGVVTEIERLVAKDDAAFAGLAKVSEEDARNTALTFNPGKVVQTQYELGTEGTVTYQFDIQTELGYEAKVDVCAVTGKVEEANIELYEIGDEAE